MWSRTERSVGAALYPGAELRADGRDGLKVGRALAADRRTRDNEEIGAGFGNPVALSASTCGTNADCGREIVCTMISA